ncbi:MULTISPECIES: hypothetical protein [Cohnella]|uniref:hypothetical protein n=1 Tax=Cohnella TaxID=329857 RepID=UPI0009BA8E9D|nr:MULTISPECIES: hypothetical protein [Cohnella]MBN2982934.1 hypothetical protein [Cohnella algarum]
MNREQAWEVKLSLLASIARSQEALARILESVADVTEGSSGSAAVLREHVRVISNMQRALLGTAAGGTWAPPVRGEAAAPWLNERLVPHNLRRRNTGGMPQ